MFAWKNRFHPVVWFVLMALSASSMAAGVQPNAAGEYKAVAKTGKLRYTEAERSEEVARRDGIVRRANDLFTLMSGEMALQKGDAATALATYMVIFDRTKDPVVAERAIDMALSLHAYGEAEVVFQKWQEAEPVPGTALRRMALVRNLIYGDLPSVEKDFADVMANADEDQQRRLFLSLAQAAVQRQDVARRLNKQVHRESAKHQDMPEAMIADALFSAYAGNQKDAVRAVKRLSVLDGEMLPSTELTLRLISQQQPEVLNRFFAESNTEKLSPMWQRLQLESLIHAGKAEEAYALLQKLLAQNPDSDLYLQAALLSVNQKAELPVTLGYLDKAYKYGTQEQQSRAAVIAAIRNGEAKDFKQAHEWAAKIKSPEYVFDKAVLQASLNAEEGNWQQALAVVQRAQSLPEQQGRFYGSNDLLRVQLIIIAKQQNSQKALNELNLLHQRVSKQPDNQEQLADVLYQRAMVYADKLNQPEMAVADLRRFQELKPNTPDGMNSLGYTLLSLPNPNIDEAFELIQAAYQQDPESAAINDSMGWVYYLKGDLQAAQPYLEYAFKAYPDPEVAAHLGEVYWKLGKENEARAVFERGLQQKEGKLDVLRQTMRRLGVMQPSAK